MTEVLWMEIFGDNLKSAMLDAGLTQRELSDATGIAQSTISKYIHKQQMPSMKAVNNIAYALDIDIEDLIPNVDLIH